MSRIDQIRRQDLEDQRTRWWRDGLVGVLIGATAGIIGVWRFSVTPLVLIPLAAAVGGVLGAIFGVRVLQLFNW